MVRWKTKKPFSANPDDWSKGKLVTDTSKPGEGVLDAAISPDGKQMAVVVLGADGRAGAVPRQARRLPAAATRSRSACARAR